MFSRLDPLVSFSCPRCQASLRFRRVLELPSSQGSPHFLCACPVCGGSIVARQHPAFPDNWRWVRFILPGLLASAVGIFVPQATGLLPWAMGLLAIGLLALAVYMVWQRWGWRCYELPAEPSVALSKTRMPRAAP